MKKYIIITAYILAFWIFLPALIIFTSVRLQTLLDFNIRPAPVSGGIIFAVSVILLATAIVQYYRCSGNLPVSAFPPRQIIRTGLFNYWRHPLYLFYILSFIGLALVWGSKTMLYAVIPVFILLTYVYALIEEKQLEKRFGDAYTLYKSQTGLVIPVFYQVMRYPVVALFRFLFGFRCKNPGLIPAPPFFIIAEHKNYLDPFFIAVAIPFPVIFPATYEVFRSPVLKWFMQRLFSIPRKRYKPDYSSVKQIMDIMGKGGVIGLFPEGERSWTGETQPFKPEVMRLLCKMNHIPLLPVKIDGDYPAWPRWAKGFRKYKVTVEFREPFFPGPDCSAEKLEKRIRDILVASGTPQKLKGKNNDLVRGLEKVFYRCSRCRVFNGFTAAGYLLVCRKCGLKIELFSDLSIHFDQDGLTKTCTIGEYYQTIRVTPEDSLFNTGCEVDNSNNGQEKNIVDLRESGQCRLTAETGKQFQIIMNGALVLGETEVIFQDGNKRISGKYLDVSSITTERNDKLQIYNKAEQQLYQVEFPWGSVLQWQDILTSVIFLKTGRLINTR